MSKIVDLFLLSVFWIIGCLPVVTLLTSTASMYHTVVKCVRYDRGSVFREFMEAYKKNLKQGIGLTILYGALGALIGIVDYQVFVMSVDRTILLFAAAFGMVLLSVLWLLNVLWLVPVFSRFLNSLGNIIKLNYVVAGRHLLRSIPILAVVAVSAVLTLAVNELILILPALVMLVNSYLAEPALRKYMPAQEEDNGDWRYGFQ